MTPQPLPPSRYRFPNPETADSEEAIVCTGGDFAPSTVLEAYRNGIFPWPVDETFTPWCSPNPRAIFPLDGPAHCSRSLRRTMRSGRFRITLDTAFDAVVEQCTHRDEGTWITKRYRSCYRALHKAGWAHSIEVWNDADALVGGLYGIAIGAMFAGESMFHTATDASKVAFVRLSELLRGAGYELFDAQVPTPHLESLGCVPVARTQFLKQLRHAIALSREFPTISP